MNVIRVSPQLTGAERGVSRVRRKMILPILNLQAWTTVTDTILKGGEDADCSHSHDCRKAFGEEGAVN